MIWILACRLSVSIVAVDQQSTADHPVADGDPITAKPE
jgi:hypothetical protein